MASDERAKTTQADATNEADQALGAVTDALPSVTETAGDSIGGVAADAGSDDSVNQAADAVSASVAEAAADAGQATGDTVEGGTSQVADTLSGDLSGTGDSLSATDGSITEVASDSDQAAGDAAANSEDQVADTVIGAASVAGDAAESAADAVSNDDQATSDSDDTSTSAETESQEPDTNAASDVNQEQATDSVKAEEETADVSADAVVSGASIALDGVTFEHASATLKSSSSKVLDKAAETLKLKSDLSVGIAGYTDNTGSNSINTKLSQKRADAVKAYLESKGVTASQLTAKGYGAESPVADNETQEGRDQNRRVELHVK